MSGQYRKAHFARAVTLANGPSRRETALRVGVAVLFAAGYAYLVYEFLTGGERGTVWIGRRAISLVIVAYVLFSPYVKNWLLVHNLWKDTQKDPSVAARLDMMGLTFLPSTADVQFKWDTFARMVVAADMIVLVIPDGTFAVLPRDMFPDDDAWLRASQLVQSRVKTAIESKDFA